MGRSAAIQSAVFGALLSAVTVSAHGSATALVQFPGGVFFAGYNPQYQYIKPPPTVVGWSTPDDLQNTFISPTAYSKPDIVCHAGATPAGAEAAVNAGDVLEVQWNAWPVSHKGPVLDYLAKCSGACTSADKTKLKFFKIGESGLIDAAADLWGGNLVAQQNNSWLIKLPTDIAPGDYVLRHEIIALHAAGQLNGAQSYPFCFNLAISSNGTKNPDGIPATSFYKAEDPGIKFDLFSKHTTYVIPGPPLYSGALSVAQSKGAAIKATTSGIASYVAVAKATSAEPSTPAVAAPSTPVATVGATTAPLVPSAPGAKPPPSAGRFTTSTKVETTRVTTTSHVHKTMTTTLVRVRREAGLESE